MIVTMLVVTVTEIVLTYNVINCCNCFMDMLDPPENCNLAQHNFCAILTFSHNRAIFILKVHCKVLSKQNLCIKLII